MCKVTSHDPEKRPLCGGIVWVLGKSLKKPYTAWYHPVRDLSGAPNFIFFCSLKNHLTVVF